MADWQPIIGQLNSRGLTFGPGLTDAEVASAEATFAFHFPPDLREFLQTALPVGDGFPDWRSGEESVLRDWLNIPREGILFDIDRGGFWMPEWGPRPDTVAAVLDTSNALQFVDEMVGFSEKATISPLPIA